jgi:protein-disulfide isomerase
MEIGMSVIRWRGFLPAFGAPELSNGTAQVFPLMVAVRWSWMAAIALCLATAIGPSASAQVGEVQDLNRMVDELRTENAALKQEVAELRATLKRLMTPSASAAGGPPATEISIAGLAARGQPNAPVTMVAFSDYQSPQCAQFHRETYPRIDEEYVQLGTVRYVFKNFPDKTSHALAHKAHEAAACAGDQRKYWEMHDLLFADQTALAPEDLLVHARTLGLDTDVFRYCLTSGAYDGLIRRDVDEGKKGGVPHMPVFAVGLTEPGPRPMKVMRVVVGSQPYAVFQDAIEAVLSTAGDDQ